MADPVNIFDYARRSDDSNIATDPVDDFFKQKRNAETSTFLMNAPDPDRTARVSKVSRETQLPTPVVDDSLDALEAKKQVERMVGLMNEYGAIGRWGSDKRNVAVAADDYDSLSALGKIWYGVKNAPGMVVGALGAGTIGGGQLADDLLQGMNRFNRTVTYPISGVLATAENAFIGTDTMNPDKAARRSEAAYQARREFRNAEAEFHRPQVENWLAKNLLAGVESVPLTVAAAATRSPTGGTALMGTLVGAGEYQRGVDKGLNAIDAVRFGATQGAIEFATEKLPLGKLISDVAKKTPAVWGNDQKKLFLITTWPQHLHLFFH